MASRSCKNGTFIFDMMGILSYEMMCRRRECKTFTAIGIIVALASAGIYLSFDLEFTNSGGEAVPGKLLFIG